VFFAAALLFFALVSSLTFRQLFTESIKESIIKANDKGKIKIRKVDDNTADKVEIELIVSTDSTGTMISESPIPLNYKRMFPLFPGVRITDLRIKQIDLPTDSRVIDDVYNRMRAQRQQVASRLRAEGEEQANEIRAGADRDQQVILAEAERDAQKLRGEGDAEAARIYADAANRDPSFYAFQRSLEAYRKAFSGSDSVIVLERNDPFLQYMRSDR